ncbi:DgyrCDS13581 [Dimorphilus gyrociliatus]|uniref:DgyrCDS13581 n=1 Tax=Dimorphilus gyrociliatus TaxID=2664684 RepID=A0A7I8WB17_9ANNE|nr:DgyrCDS13581 [Dimorphilus gyrociliatus]
MDKANAEMSRSETLTSWGLFLLFILLLSYVTIGAYSFSVLEYDREYNGLEDSRNFTSTWLSNHQSCVEPEDLSKLVKRIIQDYRTGVLASPAANKTVDAGFNWEFRSAILFAETVITTIGYGHLFPSTTAGRVFCIFYAAFGIPLTGIFLSELGKRMACISINCYVLIATKVFKTRPFDPSQSTAHLSAILVILFPFSILTFIIISAAAIYVSEGWTYFEALYFCVITMTTIGFGDLVPHKRYRYIATAWIFCGLACFSTCINLSLRYASLISSSTSLWIKIKTTLKLTKIDKSKPLYHDKSMQTDDLGYLSSKVNLALRVEHRDLASASDIINDKQKAINTIAS